MIENPLFRKNSNLNFPIIPERSRTKINDVALFLWEKLTFLWELSWRDLKKYFHSKFRMLCSVKSQSSGWAQMNLFHENCTEKWYNSAFERRILRLSLPVLIFLPNASSPFLFNPRNILYMKNPTLKPLFLMKTFFLLKNFFPGQYGKYYYFVKKTQ